MSPVDADFSVCPVRFERSEGANPKPVVDLDIHSDVFAENNYATYESLRQCPVAWTTDRGGYWILTGYDACFDATRDDETFISSLGTSIKIMRSKGAVNIGPVPIETDPPITAEYRKVAAVMLSPASVAEREDDIRKTVNLLIDAFIEDGQADLVAALMTPLPAITTLQIMGMSIDDWQWWVRKIHDNVHSTGNEIATQMELFGRIEEVIAARRASGLQYDDLLNRIMTEPVNGEPMPVEEQVRYVWQVLLGGMDTTSGFTGNTLLRIGADPELRSRLIEDRDALKHATEEFLRLGTPTQGLARVVSRDVVFHGQHMKEGDRVMIMWAAANRDSAEFDDPDSVDIDRKPNRHQSFGVGNHRCLGSNLARTMFRIMIDEILERIPDFVIVEEGVERFPDAGNIYATSTLPVRFTPGIRKYPSSMKIGE